MKKEELTDNHSPKEQLSKKGGTQIVNRTNPSAPADTNNKDASDDVCTECGKIKETHYEFNNALRWEDSENKCKKFKEQKNGEELYPNYYKKLTPKEQGA